MRKVLLAILLQLPSVAFASHGTVSLSSGDAISLTADNEFDLYIDGVFFGGGDDWSTGATFALDLDPGPHVIAVRTRNLEDLFYGGWIFDLALEDGDHLITDASWRFTTLPAADWTQLSADDSSWSNAEVKGPFGIAPWLSSPAIMAGTSAFWIGSRSDALEPAGDFYYRRVFTIEEPAEPDPVLCSPARRCACILFPSTAPPGLCTCPQGSQFNPATGSCDCPATSICMTCPMSQVYNPAIGGCQCATTGNPNGCDPAVPIDDCPPEVDICPDTYESIFEPFQLHGDHGVQQCGTPSDSYRPANGGWVSTVNTNFTSVSLGSGDSGGDDYLSEPLIEDDTYAMLLQRHHSSPPELVDYRFNYVSYQYQGGTRSLTIEAPAPDFESPDGLTPATVDKEVDLVQSDLVSVRYHVGIQSMPYDRISGLRFRAEAPGISAAFVSSARIDGNVPGGVDPASVAGHVYTTNTAQLETVTGELLLPRGHLYTIEDGFVEFMDLLGVPLNEVKIKDPETFTLDLRNFSGCTADVYFTISKPAGRIMGELVLQPGTPPLLGPRVTRYSPSYLGHRINNTLDGERLGYFVNGTPKYITAVLGAAPYDFKCIAYDRWLPVHRANSVTAEISWPAGFGVGSGWLRWPAHGETAMSPIDIFDNQTIGLDRDGFVYLDGPDGLFPDPQTTDGPGLIYPAPIGPLEMYTEEIFYDTRMAYLNGRVALDGCIDTDNIVSGWTRITGLSDGPRGSFADERGINRLEVNGAQRGEAHGIFRSALGHRGEYQIVGTDGPWREGYYRLNLRRGTDPDDWQNYYNGTLVVNTNPPQDHALVGHTTVDADDRVYETGVVRIRMRVRNAPGNPEFRPFRSPQAFIGSGALPTFLYTDSTGQTGRYYSDSTGSATVQTTHYLSIIGVADSVVNITLRAAVPENPDGTGRFFTSGFPPLLRVPIRGGETCIDLCTDASGNQVACEEDCADCSAVDACHVSWCDPVTRQCTSVPLDCDDGDDCTVDSCAGGVCVSDFDTDDDGICECAAPAHDCSAGPDPCPGDTCNLCDEQIDIKPSASPSVLNLASPYALPVVVFGSADLDVTALDLGSLSFDVADPSNTAAIKLKPNGWPQVHHHDVNGDGVLDVELGFVIDGAALACIGDGVLVGAVNGCTAQLHANHDLASDPVTVFNATQSCR